MMSLFLSRILGLARDAVIAGRFGANDFTDAFRLSFQLPDLLFFVFAGGALSAAFIPVFSEYLHTKREDEAWHVFSVVTTVVIVFGLICMAGSWALSSPIAHLLAPGKADPAHLTSLRPTEFYDLMAQMSRVVLPATLALVIGGLLVGALYAKQVFSAPGFSSNLYNLGIIVGALQISMLFIGGFGVIGMSWGALLGAIIGSVVVPLFAFHKVGRFRPSLDLKHEGVKRVFAAVVPLALGFSLPGLFALILQSWATRYNSGSNTILDFANTIVFISVGAIGSSMATAVAPALSQFMAQERIDLFRNQLSATVRTVIYLTVPITVLTIVMAPQVVSAVYKQGQFSAEDVSRTTSVLRYYAIGIPAFSLSPVLIRGFFAAQVTKAPVLISLAATAIFVGCICVLQVTSLSLLGLPLAASLGANFFAVMLLASISRISQGMDYSGIVATIWKSTVGAVGIAIPACVVTLTPLSTLIESIGKVAIFGSVTIVFAISFWIYYYITRSLNMPEMVVITRSIERSRAK